MGTKIYKGMILQNSSIEQALRNLISIKSQFVDAAEKAAAKVCAREMAFSVDLAANFCVLGEQNSIEPGNSWRNSTWPRCLCSVKAYVTPSGILRLIFA